MLRRMVQHNFVHFKDRIAFDFSKTGNGPSIFVGGNSKGKTAALELIRRCMDSKLNSSLTNRFNPDKKAYVFCEFHIEINQYGCTVITGMIVDNKENRSPEYEEGRERREIQEEDEEYEDWAEMETGTTMFHKVIMFTYKNVVKFCSKTYTEKHDGSIFDFRKNVKLETDLIRGILDEEGHLCRDIDESFDDDFVGRVVEQIKLRQRKNQTYNLYPKLWAQLEEKFVGVLPTRGLGTIQWTKSQYIDYRFKSMNYEGTCAHAEIITELLDSDAIDQEKEQEIFRFLTSPNQIVFRKKRSSTTGSTQIVVEHDGNEFPLLKTSVGVIEAKQFSLIMAHKSFQTICLEEPDRGMHPHMIERMKDVLHCESSRKTVIIVTHNPYLLDSMSLEKVFIFFKLDNATCVRNIIECERVRKIIEIEDLKRILFSSHVIFVEGKSDKTVLQSIFRHTFATPDMSMDEKDKFLSYEIISMGGKDSRDKVADFCRSINIKYCFLLDRDAYIKMNKDGISGKVPYLDLKFSKISDFLENEFEALSERLAKKENTFIWMHGDLEDFLLSVPNACKNFCKVIDLENRKMDTKIKKTLLKESLNKGMSLKQSKELAEVIKDFSETKRLNEFLKAHLV